MDRLFQKEKACARVSVGAKNKYKEMTNDDLALERQNTHTHGIKGMFLLIL
jgi:hypothetical protein